MIEIIPNWHPIFVHFTVSLYTISVIFYVLAFLYGYIAISKRPLFGEFDIVARWCLWSAAFITIFTVIAGFYAYYTVKHDAVSHAAMVNHRNWALPTAIAIFIVAIWSEWRYFKRQRLSLFFLFILILVEAMLLSTAWRGGELVYRHGVGVMSLPKPEHHAEEKNTHAH